MSCMYGDTFDNMFTINSCVNKYICTWELPLVLHKFDQGVKYMCYILYTIHQLVSQ